MSKKSTPFKLDDYGSRSQRIDDLNRPDNPYGGELFGKIAVLVFVFIDFFCLKVIWNLVQTENPWYVYCVALACAIALDVPLAIAAIALKRYRQGMCDRQEKNLIMILSIAVFVITFVFSFGFRIFTRDMSFDIGTGTTMTNTISTAVETDAENPAILYAALFNGAIPLLTSISSFVISYFGYNPLGTRISRLEKSRIGLQANILEAETALAEAETTEEYYQKLVSREDDLYKEFLEQLDADALKLKQTVRRLIMKKAGTPENVAAMSQASAELARAYKKDMFPEQRLPEFLDGETDGRKEVVAAFANYVA